MNTTTNSVAGSLTRHTMTGVGAVGLAAAQDDILRLVSLLITVAGLIWSIVEKFKRPAPPPPPSPDSAAGRNNLLSAFLLSAFCLAGGGCATLDKSGVYAGDDVLYAADLAITTSYDILHTYVAWEKENRAALARWPEIKQSADAIRRDAPRWFATAHALRDAYAASPTAENRDGLQTALSVLRIALAEAAGYMARAAQGP